MDRFDLLFFLGIIMLGVGLYFFDPRVAGIAIGITLMSVAVVGAIGGQ